MGEKFKKINFTKVLESKRLLQLFSLLLGILAWLVVVTTIDTESSVVIENIPVQIDLAGSLADSSGLDVVDQTQQYVSVRITGVNYEIGSLTAENFLATLNVSTVDEPGIYTDLAVRILAIDTNFNFDIDLVTPSHLTVEFDHMVEKTFTVEAIAPNVQPASGYLINTINISPNELVVTGPQAVMDRIDRCVVENLDSMTLQDSASLTGTLKFLDEAGVELDATNLRYNIDQAFEIVIPLYEKKTLSLTFDYINVPSYIDVELLDYTMSPVDEINVGIPVGASSGLDQISLGQIDFRQIDLNKAFTFDVALLAGYLNLDNLETVSVSFDTSVYKKKSFDTQNIVLQNVPAQYHVELLSDQVTGISMIGMTSVLDDLTAADIVAAVDLSTTSLTLGEQLVPVSIQTSDNQQAWAVGQQNVLISVVPIEEYEEEIAVRALAPLTSTP